jgi:hypothetical protein
MCCGRTRPISAGPRLEVRSRGGLLFTYIGRTALTVTGPATSAIYRFPNPGASLRIDARDAPALRKVAVLRAN